MGTFALLAVFYFLGFTLAGSIDIATATCLAHEAAERARRVPSLMT